MKDEPSDVQSRCDAWISHAQSKQVPQVLQVTWWQPPFFSISA